MVSCLRTGLRIIRRTAAAAVIFAGLILMTLIVPLVLVLSLVLARDTSKTRASSSRIRLQAIDGDRSEARSVERDSRLPIAGRNGKTITPAQAKAAAIKAGVKVTGPNAGGGGVPTASGQSATVSGGGTGSGGAGGSGRGRLGHLRRGQLRRWGRVLGGGGLTLPTLPTFKPPSWYAGVYPPNSLAATIRNGWFTLLGDLTGFPYNSGLVSIEVQIAFTVTDDNGNPLAGATVTVSILNAATSALMGQQNGTSNAEGQIPIDMGSITAAASTPVIVIWEASWEGYTALDRLDGQTLGSIETLGVPIKIYTGSGSGTETKASFILQGSVYLPNPDPLANSAQSLIPLADASVTVSLCGQSATAETNAGGVYSATLGSFTFDPSQTYTASITASGKTYSVSIAGTQIQNADGRTLDVSDGEAYIH